MGDQFGVVEVHVRPDAGDDVEECRGGDSGEQPERPVEREVLVGARNQSRRGGESIELVLEGDGMTSVVLGEVVTDAYQPAPRSPERLKKCTIISSAEAGRDSCSTADPRVSGSRASWGSATRAKKCMVPTRLSSRMKSAKAAGGLLE